MDESEIAELLGARRRAERESGRAEARAQAAESRARELEALGDRVEVAERRALDAERRLQELFRAGARKPTRHGDTRGAARTG
jgi:predicted  nucleic acid-binding Zn-ribbon protein